MKKSSQKWLDIHSLPTVLVLSFGFLLLGAILVSDGNLASLGQSLKAQLTFTVNTPTLPALSLWSPVGGEQWVAGQPVIIAWQRNSTPPGSNGTTDLYIINELTSNTTFIATTPSIDNAGYNSFKWTVPNDIAPGNAYKILLNSHGIGLAQPYGNTSAISKAPLSISQALTVSSPQTSYPASAPMTINWQVALPLANLYTSFYLNFRVCQAGDTSCSSTNGPTFALVNGLVQSSSVGRGSYVWNVGTCPSLPSGTCTPYFTSGSHVRIIAQSPDGKLTATSPVITIK